jgi:rubredoxin---NAD+ reductase
MDKHVCTACGFIYDQEVGDPERGQPAGTRFEDLPDRWRCPVCLASKIAFKRIGPGVDPTRYKRW